MGVQSDYTYTKCKLIKVVDGDTLDIEVDCGFGIKTYQRFRLLGVNAPEIFKPMCQGEKTKGLEAKELVTNELTDITFTVRSEKDPDSFGRYLAHITYDKEGIHDLRERLINCKLTRVNIDCNICLFKADCSVSSQVKDKINQMLAEGGWHANQL